MASRITPPLSVLLLGLLNVSVLAADTPALAGAAAVAEVAPLPVQIAATDPLVRYIGRFDSIEKGSPRCAWSASTVALKLSGTSLNVVMREKGKNRWQIEIDGQPTTALEMRSGEHVYEVARNLAPGEHTVRLMKATEASQGVTEIVGFQANAGAKLLPLPALPRRIEVIGDSISCGYGNEAASKEEHFSPKTQNAYKTYGAIAARALGAEYVCVAWSGKKMWPNNTLPELYDRAVPQDAKSQWNFSQWAPDVVLINLATNDFNKENPEEAGWTGAYKAFIARLRTHYPKADIYCATSPMMGDFGSPRKPRTTARQYLDKVVADLNAAGDKKVRIIEFAVQKPQHGIGADWHPSVKTHEVMAQKMIETLRADLKW